MTNFLKTALAGAMYLSPLAVFAATGTGTLQGVVTVFDQLVNAIIPIVFALALLAFFWGLAMYLLNFSGEDKDKKKGRDLMMYGILVLFVAASIWGIVTLLQQSFGIQNTTGVNAPQVN